MPIEFLFNKEAGDGVSIVLLLVLAFALLLGTAFSKGGSGFVAGVAGGGIATVIAMMYTFQLDGALDQVFERLGAGGDANVFDVLATGPYVAFAGGLVGAIGAVASRTTAEVRPTVT